MVKRLKNSICKKKKSYTKSGLSYIFITCLKIKFHSFQNQYGKHMVWNDFRKSIHENGRQQFCRLPVPMD
ncbi:hypothetical protein BAU25_22600 [Bacillus albus]|uniref:Transposase n=1 Tax=Bacillus albus TaxID=2026189 RepID=A0A1J9TDU2_9BACI|nr:hypothetical protein BAU25_22600 [Bacillus albus]